MKVVVAEDYEDLSRRAAAWLRSVLAGIGNPTVVLPTGNTPIGLYRNLAADPNRQFLGNARFVQLDEYQGIPREDCRTLSRWFRSVFLQPLSIPLTALLSFDPSVPDPDGEAARVDAAVTQAGIDVCVLGAGPNGHLGFNEPGSDFKSRTRVVELSERVFEKSFTCTDYRRVMRIKNDVDKLYDTDLTDAAWSLIAPILPAARTGGRPRK